MRRPALIAAAFLGLAAGCGEAPPPGWQGYAEGEYVLLASPYAGRLLRLRVRRGDSVAASAPAFALEDESERAAREEARSRLAAAQARLENIEEAARAPQIRAGRAELAQARSALELSSAQLERERKLFSEGFNSGARLDEVAAAHARDVARVRAAQAALDSLLQPLGRQAERKAAQSEVDAARAALAQAAWREQQKTVVVPVAGLVQDTFFVEGEWVPAGRPVVALLPPGNVKARFYVRETELGAIAVGEAVEIHCDGCEQPVPARISFISTRAEYTPPVLYSKESRSKLVFLVEARPDPGAATLHPGQPLDVRMK